MCPKKVLFVTPSLARAGAEKQVVDLVNGLAGHKYQCYLTSFEDNRDQLIRINQDQVSYLPLKRTRKIDPQLVRNLAEIIDKQGIEILHCTLSIAILYGVLARKMSKRRPKMVAGIHTTISRNTKDEILERWLYRWILRSAEKVVFVCHRQMEYWIKRDPQLVKNSTVIYNGVDCQQFSPRDFQEAAQDLRLRLGISPQDPVFCCIAAFRPEKAQDNILHSMATLKKSFDNIRVVFAGDGQQRAKVEALAKELQLENQTHFLGNIPDVRPVLAAADFSVIASTAVETFSFAMLESMSMGTPVISSRIGGADEAVIPDETGLLITPGDVPSLTKAISKMITDPSNTKQMGEKSRKKVEQIFSIDTMIQKTDAMMTGI